VSSVEAGPLSAASTYVFSLSLKKSDKILGLIPYAEVLTFFYFVTDGGKFTVFSNLHVVYEHRRNCYYSESKFVLFLKHTVKRIWYP
jgi:hypothetical protein